MSLSRLHILTLFLLVCARPVRAQESASQQVTIVIEEVSAIAVSSAAVTLRLQSATPGLPPAPATDASTSYDFTTNATAKKITGRLSTRFSEGLALAVRLTPPSGGQTFERILTTEGQDLVMNLGNTRGANLGISYRASATTALAPSDGETRTVVFTVADM